MMPKYKQYTLMHYCPSTKLNILSTYTKHITLVNMHILFLPMATILGNLINCALHLINEGK
ncbi:hypothetical protein ABID22_002749 [Pontibacter aydingkolensis]